MRSTNDRRTVSGCFKGVELKLRLTLTTAATDDPVGLRIAIGSADAHCKFAYCEFVYYEFVYYEFAYYEFAYCESSE